MDEKVNVTRKQYFVESSDNDFGGDDKIIIIYILDNEFIKFNLVNLLFNYIVILKNIKSRIKIFFRYLIYSLKNSFESSMK